MKQYFKEFIYWEDYLNGMYDIPLKKDEESLTLKGFEMLSNPILFEKTCHSVLKYWQISSKVNLTNRSCNRKAWLGQAACNFLYGVPELCTRQSWAMLTETQKLEANIIAEKFINSFELNYEKKDTELYS